MNENEDKEDATEEYEAPEVFELGQADDLTKGKGGDWHDNFNRWWFVP